MKIGNKILLTVKTIILTVILIFSGLQSYASVHSLSAIEVLQNNNGEYSIILKADKKLPVKKEAFSNSKLSLLLNSTLPSESMDIIYDNSPDIKNIIVQKKNKNNTVILFEGLNINNSKVYLKDMSSGTMNIAGANNIFNNFNKTDIVVSSGLFLLMLMLISNKNRNKKYEASNKSVNKKQKRQLNVNTLRNKNLVQSKNIPSISSKINGSFTSAKVYMSIPQELSVNEDFEEEQIRKAG